MDFYTLVFVCTTYLSFSKILGDSPECDDSAETAKIVKSCPQNNNEWNKAAKIKGCEKMSHSCSSFVYHCVINAWGNETIEVCARPVMIVGNACAEYNYGGRRIQRNGNFHCEECPPYFSNESYRYQECYEYVKNVKTSQTTQLTTESKDKESTTQGMIYLSSSLTPNEESARLYQDTDTPKTSSHIIIIVMCVVVGLAAIAVVFTVKRQSLTGKLFACFKKTVLQNEDLNAQPSEIVIESVEEGLEVNTVLLDKRTHTFIQDTFRELNES